MNVTFIGMSGAGKSTIGRIVAEQLGCRFYDVDREMETKHGKPLQAILDELGDEQFLKEQSLQLTSLGAADGLVIAPGGSVVYTPEAMAWAAEHTRIVYLKVPLKTLEERLEITGRGIVGLGERSFSELLAEREGLYEQYAEHTVDTAEKGIDEVVHEVLAWLRANR